MARIAGRRGRLYASITSGGTAEPIAFLSQWSIDFSTDRIDVTAFGDGNKVKVAGLAEATGSYSGFYDDATAQLFTAASDGQARKFYLYPDTNTNGRYWYGTATFDTSYEGSVDGAVTTSGDWEAASTVTGVGI